jgi:hypothetical protein
MTPSGVRIGTSALATRGFGDEEFTEVADIIATAPADPRMSRHCAPVLKLTDGYNASTWTSSRPLAGPDYPRPCEGRFCIFPLASSR